MWQTESALANMLTGRCMLQRCGAGACRRKLGRDALEAAPTFQISVMRSRVMPRSWPRVSSSFGVVSPQCSDSTTSSSSRLAARLPRPCPHAKTGSAVYSSQEDGVPLSAPCSDTALASHRVLQDQYMQSFTPFSARLHAGIGQIFVPPAQV